MSEGLEGAILERLSYLIWWMLGTGGIHCKTKIKFKLVRMS